MLTYLLIISAIAIIILLIPKKRKPTINEPQTVSRTRVYYEWLKDQQNARYFCNYLNQYFEENEEYYRSARPLKRDYFNEKVYRYMPYRIPLKIKENAVYSYVKEGEWLKVGKLREDAQINGIQKLFLFPNVYKYVTEDSVQKESDEPYFGLEIMQIDE